MLSILISSHNRANLLRRTLHSILKYPPDCPYEVVLADDGSTDDILGVLREYNSLPWTFVRCDRVIFERQTGITPFFNCPAWTNNVAARHSVGDLLCLQGNEVMVTRSTYKELLRVTENNLRGTPISMAFATTYDMPVHLLGKLTRDGDNLDEALIEQCAPWVLQSIHFTSHVTNYCSVCPKELWDEIGGYDERYLGGIGAEDFDFVRRVRSIPSSIFSVCEGAITIHQSHGGKTRFYNPRPDVIGISRFEEGCEINRERLKSWDGSFKNTQPWEWGSVGVTEIITSND